MKRKNDIIALILSDHEPLKRLIQAMKAPAEMEMIRPKFEEFALLLEAHAKPEEESLYVRMKEEADFRRLGFEGDTEHEIADRLCHEIRSIDDEDLFLARVKVLAELVENHLAEEEEKILPALARALGATERAEIGAEYLAIQHRMHQAEQRAA